VLITYFNLVKMIFSFLRGVQDMLQMQMLASACWFI